MYQEKRPTCVTVIGWVWIIIGVLMCLSAIIALINSVMMGDMFQDNPDIPFVFKIFPYLAAIQLGFAILGIISGFQFLKLKAWPRNILEILTWILIIFVFGFMIFWILNWISATSGHGPAGSGTMGTAMGIIITVTYGVPLIIMLKYLRGDKVKDAIAGTYEER